MNQNKAKNNSFIILQNLILLGSLSAAHSALAAVETFHAPSGLEITHMTSEHPIFGEAWCYKTQTMKYGPQHQICYGPTPSARVTQIEASRICNDLNKQYSIPGTVTRLPEPSELFRLEFHFTQPHTGLYAADQFAAILGGGSTSASDSLYWAKASDPALSARGQAHVFHTQSGTFSAGKRNSPVGIARCISFTVNGSAF